MMLPFEKRTNKLLGVLIRSTNLEFSIYHLQLITSCGKIFNTTASEFTMVNIVNKV